MELRRRCQTINKLPSRTQQQFKNDCNINSIIEKAKRFGMPQPSAQPMFGNFCFMDFQEMQNKVIEASNLFMSLGPKIREKFQHDPARLIEFLEKEENREEAIKLGLLPEPEKKKETEPMLVRVVPPVSTLDVTGGSDTKQS